MEIQMTITIDLGDNFIDSNDKVERDWLFNEVLQPPDDLFLHSGKIGDYIGGIIKIENIKELK